MGGVVVRGVEVELVEALPPWLAWLGCRCVFCRTDDVAAAAVAVVVSLSNGTSMERGRLG